MTWKLAGRGNGSTEKKYIPVSESEEEPPAIKYEHNRRRSRTFFNVFNLLTSRNTRFVGRGPDQPRSRERPWQPGAGDPTRPAGLRRPSPPDAVSRAGDTPCDHRPRHPVHAGPSALWPATHSAQKRGPPCLSVLVPGALPGRPHYADVTNTEMAEKQLFPRSLAHVVWLIKKKRPVVVSEVDHVDHGGGGRTA